MSLAAVMSPGDGMQQGLDYATTLDIPFVFSSNGDGFVFHDRTGASTTRETNLALDGFPSPADLWARSARCPESSGPYMEDGSRPQIRFGRKRAGTS